MFIEKETLCPVRRSELMRRETSILGRIWCPACESMVDSTEERHTMTNPEASRTAWDDPNW